MDSRYNDRLPVLLPAIPQDCGDSAYALRRGIFHLRLSR